MSHKHNKQITPKKRKVKTIITVANRIFVPPEYTEAFEERFRARAGLVDGIPGFISNQVLRPVNEEHPYIIPTFWEFRDRFEAWIKSEEFVKEHARSGTLPKEAFTAPNQLKIHEVVLDSSRPNLSQNRTAICSKFTNPR